MSELAAVGQGSVWSGQWAALPPPRPMRASGAWERRQMHCARADRAGGGEQLCMTNTWLALAFRDSLSKLNSELCYAGVIFQNGQNIHISIIKISKTTLMP